MDFGFSDEQDLLREQVRKFLDEQCPLEEVRRILETQDGYSKAQWKALAELGFLGLLVPEAYGGAGLGFEDLVVLLEETGRTLYPSPLISTTLAAALVVEQGSDAQKQRLLTGIASGSVVATVAICDTLDDFSPEGISLRGTTAGEGFSLTGEKRFVGDAAQADVFLVAFRTGDAPLALSLAVVEREAAGVRVEVTPTLDTTKRQGTLHLENVRVEADAVLGTPGEAGAAVQHHLDRGAVFVAAEIVGVIEGALAITVQFAKDRIQFGQPIGHYQGVKHPLAEIYVDLECLKSLVYHAAWALDSSPEDAPVAVSEAKSFGAVAVTRTGIDCIQLHGAVGYTLEYDIQLYLKRSKWARAAFGDEDHHYERIATLGGY